MAKASKSDGNLMRDSTYIYSGNLMGISSILYILNCYSTLQFSLSGSASYDMPMSQENLFP